jgi:hypothetical protein
MGSNRDSEPTDSIESLALSGICGPAAWLPQHLGFHSGGRQSPGSIPDDVPGQQMDFVADQHNVTKAE